MDSQYIAKNLMPTLTDCLSEVCLVRPSDPIEYIGNWLLQYHKNREFLKQVEKEEEVINTARERFLEDQRIQQEKERERKELQKCQNLLDQKMEEDNVTEVNIPRAPTIVISPTEDTIDDEVNEDPKEEIAVESQDQSNPHETVESETNKEDEQPNDAIEQD